MARSLEISRNTVRGDLRGERLAARVHRLLRSEGRAASASSVRRVVQEVRLELRDPLQHAHLPLEYEPGVDGQVDFFEAVVDYRDRGRSKVYVLLVRACYSRRCFAYIAPNQTREALLEGLMRSFEFPGGVFRNLWFDNLTPAVKKVLNGRKRHLQREFKCLQAHYRFDMAGHPPGATGLSLGIATFVDDGNRRNPSFSRSEAGIFRDSLSQGLAHQEGWCGIRRLRYGSSSVHDPPAGLSSSPSASSLIAV